VDVGRLLGDLRTRAFVAQVGAPEATSPEHTQPYRWRHMLAATRFGLELSGERREEILAQMPDFLLRNISGTTDAELLFHRFLVHLNVESGLLERPNLSVDAAISALGSWARELTRWGMEDGLEKVALSIVLNSGRRLLALNFGGHVSYRCMAEIEGLDSAERAAIVCVGADPPRPGFCSLETHHICVLGPGSVQELVKLER
jgi:glutamine amidotransferase